MKAAEDGSRLAGQIEEIVGPQGDGASRHGDPLHLIEELLLIEPVDRLAGGDKVDGSVLQPRILRESESGLPATGARVPAAEVARYQSRDRPEQLGRVRGPVAGVVPRVAREVILERGRAQISSRL